MWRRLAHRVVRSSQATPAAVDKSQWASHKNSDNPSITATTGRRWNDHALAELVILKKPRGQFKNTPKFQGDGGLFVFVLVLQSHLNASRLTVPFGNIQKRFAQERFFHIFPQSINVGSLTSDALEGNDQQQ
jgi:hypothetical protein